MSEKGAPTCGEPVYVDASRLQSLYLRLIRGSLAITNMAVDALAAWSGASLLPAVEPPGDTDERLASKLSLHDLAEEHMRIAFRLRQLDEKTRSS